MDGGSNDDNDDESVDKNYGSSDADGSRDEKRDCNGGRDGDGGDGEDINDTNPYAEMSPGTNISVNELRVFDCEGLDRDMLCRMGMGMGMVAVSVELVVPTEAADIKLKVLCIMFDLGNCSYPSRLHWRESCLDLVYGLQTNQMT